jgi:hypothetical protein
MTIEEDYRPKNPYSCIWLTSIITWSMDAKTQGSFICQMLDLPRRSIIALPFTEIAIWVCRLILGFSHSCHVLGLKDNYTRNTLHLNFMTWVKNLGPSTWPRLHRGCHSTARNYFWHVKQLIETSRTTQNCRSSCWNGYKVKLTRLTSFIALRLIFESRAITAGCVHAMNSPLCRSVDPKFKVQQAEELIQESAPLALCTSS